MNGTRSHHRSRSGYPGQSYWGWSHENGRMEMMDLPAYVDSFRQGYESAMQDLYTRASGAFGSASPWMPGPAAYPYGSPPAGGPSPAWQDRRDRHDHGDRRHHGEHHHHGCRCEECGHHEHQHGCGHEHGWDHEGGCGHEHGHKRDCRCECCIVDADIVVYAHCGEVRVIPIEIENETRRAREDVTLDLSEVRSSGGRTLPWKALLRPTGRLTIDPCSTLKLELLVHITCSSLSVEPKGAAAKATKESGLLETVAEQRAGSGDVDRCEVGYVTIRVGGCLVRPIVAAIAVLPDSCGSYRSGCSCSCCC
jgi:hypothetical protein